MLPTELEKLCTSIRNDPNQTGTQKELLNELNKLDRFLAKIPKVNSLEEVRAGLLHEHLEISGPVVPTTSGPKSICPCCGRKL